MAQLPDAVEQVLRLHAPFIHAVANACRDRALLADLNAHLSAAEEAGWGRLVAALRQVIDGRRDQSLYLGLDEEDRILLEAILRGIENPATLPPLNQQSDPATAAPGLAAMIQAAGSGDTNAFATLANMAEQMMKAGGDMARLGGIMRRLVDGERDADLLTRGMSALGRNLVLGILDELAKLRLQ